MNDFPRRVMVQPPDHGKEARQVSELLASWPRHEAWPAKLAYVLDHLGERVVKEPGLEVPHPRLHERIFVLAPLAEVAPFVVHPVLSRPIADLLAALPSSDWRDTRPVASLELDPGGDEGDEGGPAAA